MKKKLLSLVLAATMLLGASMTVFAATTTTDVSGGDVSSQITATGEVQEIEIKVTITTNGTSVLLNPYGVVDNTAAPQGQTLVMKDISFKNLTPAPVALGLKGAVDVSGNAITVNAATVRPAPTTAQQVNVNVSYENGSNKKLVSTATARAGDAPVSYEAGTSGKEKALKLSPVMAAKDDNNAVKDTKGVEIADTNYSDTIVLKFGGWSLPSTTKQWSSDAIIKVYTVYNFETADASKRSMFKTIATTP